MEKLILGMTYGEITRQCAADIRMRDTLPPIRTAEILHPCIAGGKKILADEKTRDFLQKAYVGA